jgi:superfamily II DNA/RNA helicase
VREAIAALAKDLPGPKVVALYGGVSINPQLMSLRGGADFVVATPGRLLDVLQNNGFRIQDIDVLVLDEADRMLDLGFADELNAIFEQLPKVCQRLMFSALMAPKTHSLAMHLLHDPVHIALSAPSDDIEQRAIEVDHDKRLDLLMHLIEKGEAARALVFCASRVDTEDLAQSLRSRGVKAEALYGGLPQDTRDQVLGDLKDGVIEVLVATDLAARGIDISALPLVVNYDLPRSPSLYTQRIGRTGRAGQRGLAISFVDADSHAHFKLIEKRLGFSVEREQIPGFLPVDVPNPRLLVGDSKGGIKGKRPSKKDKLRAAAAKKASKE